MKTGQHPVGSDAVTRALQPARSVYGTMKKPNILAISAFMGMLILAVALQYDYARLETNIRLRLLEVAAFPMLSTLPLVFIIHTTWVFGVMLAGGVCLWFSALVLTLLSGDRRFRKSCFVILTATGILTVVGCTFLRFLT